MENKAIIIGAGIGGLATALRLNKLGYKVSVFEKSDKPGGKANELRNSGFRFDTGPSLFTMPWILEDLFNFLELDIKKYLEYKKLDILCKYFYSDNTIINAYSDKEKFIKEMTEKTTDGRESFIKYFNYTNNIYNLTHKIFLENSLSEPDTYLNLDALKSLINLPKIDTNRTMANANSKYFKDPKTLQLFNRYATYNGSNPFKAPATLNIISHVENEKGGYFINGGIYKLIETLTNLCISNNIELYYNTHVKNISVIDNKIQGITVIKNGKEEFLTGNIVISNSDVLNTYKNLLTIKDKGKIKKYENLESSTSAIVFYWGIKGEYAKLKLHNILFSKDYKNEFEELFNYRIIPNDPTVYIYISSKENSADAPTGYENWFVMINSPINNGQKWNEELLKAKEKIINRIEKTLNINIKDKIVFEKTLSPKDIEELTDSYKGSLYGIASNNKMSAFMREQNRSSKYLGLYFVGGSVHPGGGIPLVMLSAKITSQLIKKYQPA
ncbi:MAG TPA: phytoene desaturase family protein [Melioribacteraceae bacterium]|nr:phytoene desaturase family protein [Melioribacteraceae bacterium]